MNFEEAILLWLVVLLLLLGPLALLPFWGRVMRTERPYALGYILASGGVFIVLIMTNLSAAALYCFATHLGETEKCAGNFEDWGLNPGILIGIVTAVFLGWVWIRRILPEVRPRAIHLSVGLVFWYMTFLSIVHLMDPGR